MANTERRLGTLLITTALLGIAACGSDDEGDVMKVGDAATPPGSTSLTDGGVDRSGPTTNGGTVTGNCPSAASDASR